MSAQATATVQITKSVTLDLALYSVSEQTKDLIFDSLHQYPSLTSDRVDGMVRFRIIDGFEVCFMMSVVKSEVIATIFGIRPQGKRPKSGRWQKALELLAAFRSATGL